MDEYFDYSNLEINSIFEPVRKMFEFFVLSIGFVGQFEFQDIFLKFHPEMNGYIKTYNKEVNLRKEGNSVKSETRPYWITLGRMMAISLFNILEFSEYNSCLNQEEIYKFAKHLRNGAAHNNRFFISPPIENPIIWRDKMIENSLNKKEVFPSYISPASLVVLMSDISKLIITKSRKIN
jgi:hypothetical protein